MRALTIILLLVTMLLAITPAAAQGPSDSATPDLAAVCQDAVEGMNLLTGSLRLPDHFMETNPTKAAGDFDVADYFPVLDHLSVESGYFLDYVYMYDGMGGFPVLYTLPEDEEPFATLADYSKAGNTIRRDVPGYLNRIVIDGTPEGYVQMVVLDVMGDQFYLHWHANYNDWQLVCSDEVLQSLLSSDNLAGDALPADVRTQARALDVVPTVEQDEDVVRVQVVLFSQWGGFFRVTFTMSDDYPRAVYESERELLVEYNCGIMF